MKDLIQSIISISSLYYEGVYDDEMLKFQISNLKTDVDTTYLNNNDTNDIINQIRRFKHDILR